MPFWIIHYIHYGQQDLHNARFSCLTTAQMTRPFYPKAIQSKFHIDLYSDSNHRSFYLLIELKTRREILENVSFYYDLEL